MNQIRNAFSFLRSDHQTGVTMSFTPGGVYENDVISCEGLLPAFAEKKGAAKPVHHSTHMKASFCMTTHSFCDCIDMFACYLANLNLILPIMQQFLKAVKMIIC